MSTRFEPVSGPGAGGGASAGRRGYLAVLRWLAAALLAGASVVVLRVSGLLDGACGAVLAVALLVLVPSSAMFSRRLLLNGVIALGFLPLLWWHQLPLGEVGRVTLVLALVIAAMVGWVVHAGHPADRLRRLIPRVGWADLAPLGAASAGAVMLSPWLRAPSGEGVLSMLMTGWDHSAHFDMTEMVRQHGAAIWALASPTGTAWSYDDYPQGFHTAAAAVMELLGSPVVGTPAEELILYGRAMGLVSVLGVVIVVAGIAAVPTLRRRPLVAWIPAAAVTAAFLWGPGGLILADGFPNFFLGCALLAAVPLIAIPIARWPAPIHVLALGGAVVGIAHTWALLLTMALPAALAVLLPFRSRRAAVSRWGWGVNVAIALMTGAAVATAVAVIGVQPLADVVSVGGGVSNRSIGELYGVVAGSLLAVVLLAWSAPRSRPQHLRRAAWVVVGPVVGVAVAAWIADIQLRQGDLGYYFWKYAIALELLALVVGSVAAAALVARSRGVGSSNARVLVLAIGVVVVVAAGFGSPHPAVPARTLLPESAGMIGRLRLVAASDAPTPEAARLLAAAAAMPEGARSVYVPVPPQGWHNAASVSQWAAALSGSWTDDVNEPIGMLYEADLSVEGAPGVVRRLLSSYPDLMVVVPPRVVDDIRSGLPEHLRERVLTW